MTGSDVSNSEGFLFFCPARLHSRNKATQLEQLLVGFGFATVVCKIRHCKRVRRQLAHGTGGRDAAFFSRSGSSSMAEGPSISRTASSRSRTKKFVVFQCTFCEQSFKKKYDWVRHERSIHLPGLDSWICALPVTRDQSFLVWRMSEDGPQCLFCGENSPSDEHIQAHEFDTCAERPVSERKFTRKDHLWQHLHKFHGCRKWDGWKPDLSLLQHRQDIIRSQCGFCQVMMDSWGERTDHIAAHFRSGLTMEQWVGGSGIHDPGDMGTEGR